MNKITGIVAATILLSVFGFIIISNTQKTPETLSLDNKSPEATLAPSEVSATNSNASFAIFTLGTFRVFTASMYHNLSEDVYIEASDPNTVQVRKAGTTWNDFFLTLPFKLTPECLTTGTKQTFCTGSRGTLKFYINGERNDNALNEKIKDGDQLLVTFGSESEAQIKKQLESIPQDY